MTTEVPVNITSNTRKFLGEIHGILCHGMLHMAAPHLLTQVTYHLNPVLYLPTQTSKGAR